jgi:asparagine synthase (glutamine-hydrolysing)
MCGICGFISSGVSGLDAAALKRMTSALAHRGPDGEGIFADKGVGLGHRRLSIIDLSNNASQPMSNEDGSIKLVFNGMIYNYKELARALKQKGHHFKSASDTEAIIHLYEEVGQDCVKHLRGMFAFAIWDSRKKELVLARDRIGQKPLVYSRVGDMFLFASEPKAILASGAVKPEVNPAGVHYLFSHRSVPYPNTMFKNILKLPPASVMVVKDGREHISRYWQPEMNDKLSMGIGEAVERLQSLIDESVRMRLISDVPVGAFLSGGVDSSLIASFIAKNTSTRLNAFSVGFEDSSSKDKEFGYAASVAERYNMEHHKITADSNIIDELGRVVWHYDEPFAIPEAMVNMKFCREVKKGVKAALTGDGSDELFAGYSGYLLWKILGDMDIFFSKNKAARAAIFPALGFLGERFSSSVLKALTLPPGEKRAYFKRKAADNMANLVYSKNLKNRISGCDIGAPFEEIYSRMKPDHLLDGTLFTDLVFNDTHGICVFSDISGMANGLELRSPFLDHHIVEFAMALPVWMKINGVNRKYILKRLSKPILPSGVLNRKKYGYGETIPLRSWFSTVWRKRVEADLFKDDWDKEGYFDMASVRRLWDMQVSGKADNFNILWTVYCYNIWRKIFFEGRRIDNEKSE